MIGDFLLTETLAPISRTEPELQFFTGRGRFRLKARGFPSGYFCLHFNWDNHTNQSSFRFVTNLLLAHKPHYYDEEPEDDGTIIPSNTDVPLYHQRFYFNRRTAIDAEHLGWLRHYDDFKAVADVEGRGEPERDALNFTREEIIHHCSSHVTRGLFNFLNYSNDDDDRNWRDLCFLGFLYKRLKRNRKRKHS